MKGEYEEELLAASIRTDNNIKGMINVPGTEILCQCQTVTLSHIKKNVEHFEVCTGLNVNIDKTQGKFIGSLKYITDSPLRLNVRRILFLFDK